LMCGTGVGYSVEGIYVNELPTIAEEFHETDTTIVVRDSKIGWAAGFRELVSLLYAGLIPSWDLSRVRPAGARLKTFGGRSSGPAPLNDLFNFAVNIFKEAAGRKLRPIEASDLVCKIAEIVVVGGVRRSALISLGDLEDRDMRSAKQGAWTNTHGHRRLANISAVYNGRPPLHTFMKEWAALYSSFSGERGIFNRRAARLQCEKTGRRQVEGQAFGTNPCVADSTWILTSEGPRQVKDLIHSPFVAMVDGEQFACRTGFFPTGHKEVYRLETQEGYSLDLTSNHLVKKIIRRTRQNIDTGWVEAGDLLSGDEIMLGNHGGNTWGGPGNFEEGYLVGQIVGNGGYIEGSGNKSDSAYVRFWGEHSETMSSSCLEMTSNNVKHRSDLASVYNKENKTHQVRCVGLARLCQQVGIDSSLKLASPQLEMTSSNFVRGYLSGLFDADGSVQGDLIKGASIRLGQANHERLQAVQRMLARLGIKATIYKERKAEGNYLLPNGKGGSKLYWCKAMHDLCISNTSMELFHTLIGFKDPSKCRRLEKILSSYQRRPNREKFFCKVKSFTYLGKKDVYDATIDDVHEFDANGLQVHNCSEILLRSCEFCNLTEVVVRLGDSFEEIERKVRLATILGTIQATLVDFRYLRKKWRRNCEDERLLGVSLTGIMDHEVLRSVEGSFEHNGVIYTLEQALEHFKGVAIDTNKEWSAKFGIKAAAAITCVKPSGTVSQLVNSASGIHERWNSFYIRNVRADNKDPLTRMMKDVGIPHEPAAEAPSHMTVFSFPVESDNGSSRHNRNAIDQLNHWLAYQRHWCEHKPSITVYIGKDEWFKVADWIWEHFDEVSGIAFLPKDESEHRYTQLPYQDCEREDLELLKQKMPLEIDWDLLSRFEKEDMTRGSQTLACTGNSCEIVDLI